MSASSAVVRAHLRRVEREVVIRQGMTSDDLARAFSIAFDLPQDNTVLALEAESWVTAEAATDTHTTTINVARTRSGGAPAEEMARTNSLNRSASFERREFPQFVRLVNEV